MRKCKGSVVKGFSLTDDSVEAILKTKPRVWKSGDAYIPISQKYSNHDVYVVFVNGDKK